LADRLGLPGRVPAWSVADLKRAGFAHLTAEALQRKLGETEHEPERRRLRSEIRRSVSQARTAERVLAALVSEHRAEQAARPVAVSDLLARVGRR
jgi:hypothetical protein